MTEKEIKTVVKLSKVAKQVNDFGDDLLYAIHSSGECDATQDISEKLFQLAIEIVSNKEITNEDWFCCAFFGKGDYYPCPDDSDDSDDDSDDSVSAIDFENMLRASLICFEKEHDNSD